MKYLKNKTKIVATMGPSTANRATMKQMVEAGLNVFRINFSHGTHEDHLKSIKLIREIDDELGLHAGILADLQGPKIRIGEIEGGSMSLEPGETLQFTTEKCIGTKEQIWINYGAFPKDVTPGETILLDDGKIKLEIIETDGEKRVKAKVIFGDVLSSRKGVNLPNTALSLPCLTEKDKVDLEFALKHEVPWIGLSFVRRAEDIIELREIIEKSGKSSRIIAKIEKPEAVENLDAIIAETDGVMVARGDLGVEIPLQDVPLVQKEIVRKARNAGKPAIIATQMMESMIDNYAPTRAEVNDVANAVLDGADAVMLSGETSVGKYPVEVIRTMYKIILRMEKFDGIYYPTIESEPMPDRFVSDVICKNAAELTKATQAKGIVTMTFSGYTAFKASSFRPNGYIFVFTANPKILEMLSLIWGVKGFYYNKFVSTDHTIDDVKAILKEREYTQPGDYIIHIASMPIARKGMSNMLRISHIK
ncbi:pyruvate kinase [bacterium SCSIO 12741]|nr:pyruvate kinase [bacterium SCSIO 12741]